MTDTLASSMILPLSDDEFSYIADLVYTKFGINLSEKKKALVRGRLNKLVKSTGFESFAEYLEKIDNNSSAADLLALIDRISTNHSFFFRESEHFTVLTQKVLPALLDEIGPEGMQDLRIWCAGGSAGQEAYTIAMVTREYFMGCGLPGMPSILSTDISMSALEQAVEGVYPDSALLRIPPRYTKYFRHADSDSVSIVPSLREMIMFKRLNLKQTHFPFKGKFHIIFCRNVMIYFDGPTKQDLVTRFSRYTHQGGYLFIGHSESLGRNVADYTYVEPTVYKK